MNIYNILISNYMAYRINMGSPDERIRLGAQEQVRISNIYKQRQQREDRDRILEEKT